MTEPVGNAYVGSPVPRREDARLLAGRGRFVGGLRLPDMVHAYVVRSPVAHARVTGYDLSAARAADGVVDVIGVRDASDLRLPCVSPGPGQRELSYPLLDDVVRYVGQPLAVVVAGTPAAARDAADLVTVDYDELPPAIGVEHAVDPDAPRLYPDWGTNVATDFEVGDPRGDCAAAAHDAAHVVDMTFRFGRASPYPLEPRAIVASYAEETLTIRASTQAPHHVRDHAADLFGLRYDRVRVISRETGGGFGAKEHLYPDEALVCLAAIRTGRPVRWSEEPADRLVATLPARAAVHRGILAMDADGRFVALYADVLADLGAHPANCGIAPAAVSATMLPGPYRFDRVGARVRGAVTTSTPTGSYRGFGQPEAAWTRERLIDEAARRAGIDPVELRLRNMIGPDELPYTTRTWQDYDSGDYPRVLRTLRDSVVAPHRDDGRRRGIGFACHVETTGMGPSMGMKAIGIQAGGFETAVVQMEPDASVVVSAGVVGIGQGIETALAQIAADHVGVALDDVRVVLGDTTTTPYSSIGSIASRALAVSGGALTRAAAQLRTRILEIAGHQLEVDPADLEIVDSTVRVKGTPQVARTLREIATAAWRGWDLPDGSTPGLLERVSYEPVAYTYACGAHAAAVAVDPATGAVEVEGYWLVNDSGVLVNPAIVAGQLRGAVAQGIGMALFEEIGYTPDGQPNASYDLPTTREVPDINVTTLETPSPRTPGGMKGVGEGGTVSSTAAVGNAVAAALPEIADRITDTPMTPYALWRLPRHASSPGQ
ncbi:xanthine dehydrogenase family protein molybdopterin-binding subunit [Virgisporangium aurantiacum]|uniref:xanthine dehydrogenase family protein molybdopterin-binding subunit n=1 Tax=Virgisporangium aurantiacum TaxID=175570 RepID=UPI0019528C82|nr:xanthine dehydrogenase family protein molybdopterin-binding subunit [Virgisporangium aurantiacum]